MIATLYTTLGCHLCDEALHLLVRLQQQDATIQIIEVEIADSEDLLSAYGERIPVIAGSTSEGDIGWPFSLEELKSFLCS